MKLVTVTKVHPDMELVEQPVDVHAPCTCERSYTTLVIHCCLHATLQPDQSVCVDQ